MERSLIKKIIIVSILAVIWNGLSRYISEYSNRYLILLHAGIVVALGMLFLAKHARKAILDSNPAQILLAIGFVLWGISDAFWGLNFSIQGYDGTDIKAFLCTIICSTALLVFASGILLSSVSIKKFLFHNLKILLTATLATSVFYGFLFYAKLHALSPELRAFARIEIFAVTCAFIALVCSIILFITARGIEWTLFAVGMMNLILGDNAIRVEKYIHFKEHFTINSLLVTSGLYIALVTLFTKRLCRIDPFSDQIPFLRHKWNKLNLVFLFGSILSFLIFDSELAPLLCPAFGFAFYSLAIDSGYDALREQAFREKELETIDGVQGDMNHEVAPALACIRSALDSVTDPEASSAILSALTRIEDSIETPLKRYKECYRNFGDELSLEYEAMKFQNRHSEPLLLQYHIDKVVKEKRMIYKKRANLKICFELDTSAYGVFALGRAADLEKAVGNLIRNSAEVIQEDEGVIEVFVTLQGEFAQIEVCDSGPGIPAEIIPKLGKRGATFGKKGGTGRGLFQAFTTIKQMGGRHQIQSKLHAGTKISLWVPVCETPVWFQSTLELKENEKLVIYEVDPFIQTIWENKVRQIAYTTPIFCRQESDLAQFVSQFGKEQAYFILGHNLQGVSAIDLVEKYGLSQKALIVPSDFKNDELFTACTRLQVKTLSRAMISGLKISLSEKTIGVPHEALCTY